MDGEFVEMPPMPNDGRPGARHRFPPGLWLPSGFRFHPTDLELVRDYLVKQVNSESFDHRVITEVDLLKYNPWDLPGVALFGEHDWYFFTHPELKYPNGSRPNRKAGDGYWKATGTGTPIRNGHHRLVGIRRSLVFYENGPSKGRKTDWIMHEYHLANKQKDWVLCRIKKKPKTGAFEQHQDMDSLFTEFDEEDLPADPESQAHDVVNNAVVPTTTTTTPFPAMMHTIPGMMVSTVPGLQQTTADYNGRTSNHNIASSSNSQQARLMQELADVAGLQTEPAAAFNYPNQSLQCCQPRSPSSCMVCMGEYASSSLDNFGAVQIPPQSFASYGEEILYPAFDYPHVDSQPSTDPWTAGMVSFDYSPGPGPNS